MAPGSGTWMRRAFTCSNRPTRSARCSLDPLRAFSASASVIRPPCNNYYHPPGWETAKNPALHRAVWMHSNGKIPKGYHIHHIDGNHDNNDITNLQCLSPGDHQRLHM